MKWTFIFTILLSMVIAAAFQVNERVSPSNTASTPSSGKLFSASLLKVSDIQKTLNRFLSYRISSPCPSRSIHSQEAIRFALIHQKRTDSNVEDSNPESELPSGKPNTQKSSVGDTVKKVEKKWVKIVEIVVPIAVGIPLLIILGIGCFLCCAGCKHRRQNKA